MKHRTTHKVAGRKLHPPALILIYFFIYLPLFFIVLSFHLFFLFLSSLLSFHCVGSASTSTMKPDWLRRKMIRLLWPAFKLLRYFFLLGLLIFVVISLRYKDFSGTHRHILYYPLIILYSILFLLTLQTFMISSTLLCIFLSPPLSCCSIW